MEALQNRIDSFSKSKRVKNPSKPSSSVSVKWPHPLDFVANPESLAEAGFFFSPSFTDRDTVTCYMCEKQLGGWEVKDDPFDIHWNKCGTNCCWANVRCGLRGDMDSHGGYVFSDKARLPTSKTMERARLETFSAGDGWIHDRAKNHGANSQNMARAGFVYIPQYLGDDLATCLYCNVSLSGWDADDNPMEEHRKRDKKNGNRCPFFTFSESTSTIKPPSRTQSRPTSKPSSKARSGSASKHKESALPVEGSDPEPEAAPAPPSKRPRGRPPSGTSTSGKPSRKATVSQSRNQLRGVVEDDEDIEIDDEEEVPPVVRRATRTTATAAAKPKGRSRSQSVARQVLDLEEADEVAPWKTASRTRSKTKEKITDEGEGGHLEEEEPTVLKKSVRGKRTTRKPSQASKAKRLPEPDTELQESEEGDEAPARPTSRAKAKPPSAPTSRKPSRARSKAAVAADTGGDETDDLNIMTLSVGAGVPASQQIQTEPGPSERRPQLLPGKVPQEYSPEQDEIHTPSLTSPSTSEKDQDAITETVEDLPPLLIPKRNTAPNQHKAPAAPSHGDIEIKNTAQEPETQYSSVALKPPIMTVPQPPLQVNGKGTGKGKKASILKVVEISTDEEDVEEAPKHIEKLNIEAKAEEKPLENAKLEKAVSQSDQLSTEPSPARNMELPQNSEDVVMTIVNGDNDRGEAVISLNWAPHGTPPVTPTRARAVSQLTANRDTRTGDRNPVPFCPPLSKLPFMPLQNLTEAELDMTVEEWIRYQMEVEYDKFRRDGERELARFKKRADEVRKIIEEL